MTESGKSVDQLCAEKRIDVRQLAEHSGVDEQRVLAIALGRWTPGPEDRNAIAAVFGLPPERVVWGHTTPVQHLYGRGPA